MSNEAPAAKKDKEKKVKVLSHRPGDIVLDEGTLSYRQVIELSEERAAWLVASFGEEVQKV